MQHTELGTDGAYGATCKLRDGGTRRSHFVRNWVLTGRMVGLGGSYFVADTGNHVIREVRNGTVYTVVGSGEPGSSPSLWLVVRCAVLRQDML
eukprot:1880469-Rhodomonas_salina.1